MNNPLIYDSKGAYNLVLKMMLLLWSKSKIKFVKDVVHPNDELIPLYTKVHNKQFFVRRADKGLSENLIYRGIREPEVTKSFIKILNKSKNRKSVMCDIGANIGYYSRLFLENMPQGTLYAFEPNKQNFKCLRKNLNPFLISHTFTALNVAISNKIHSVPFIEKEVANSSCVATSNDASNKRIDAYPLDYLMNHTHIDIVRMDVEGYETFILKGMTNILNRRNRPEYLFIEVHPNCLLNFGDKIEYFVDSILKKGYTFKKGIYQSSDYLSGKMKFKVFFNYNDWYKNPYIHRKAVNVIFKRSK